MGSALNNKIIPKCLSSAIKRNDNDLVADLLDYRSFRCSLEGYIEAKKLAIAHNRFRIAKILDVKIHYKMHFIKQQKQQRMIKYV